MAWQQEVHHGADQQRPSAFDGVAVARRIAQLERSDGFTFDPRTMAPARFFANEYWVSLPEMETILLKSPTEDELCTYIAHHEGLLVRSDYFLGGWLDQQRNVFCLDVSCAERGFLRAIIAGVRNRQRSIFHPASGRVIELKVFSILQHCARMLRTLSMGRSKENRHVLATQNH